jgi:hypothetical protein
VETLPPDKVDLVVEIGVPPFPENVTFIIVYVLETGMAGSYIPPELLFRVKIQSPETLACKLIVISALANGFIDAVGT